MKKLIALLMAVCMLLALCACGKTDKPNDPPQEEDPIAVDSQPAEDPTEKTTEPAVTDPEPTEPQKSALELAEECIDLPVEDLYSLIGEPDSADYAPSCLNPGVGEDGNLYYEGFIVYTYREGDTETVTYVEAAE